MPDSEEIAGQRQLLASHRSTLAVYLKQQALHGVANAPPVVENGIRDARENISRIKAILRDWGAEVEDHPDDGHTHWPHRLSPPSKPASA